MIRILLPIFFALACTAPNTNTNGHVQQAADNGPFSGLGIRYDGYYRDSRGEVLYLVRFFPEGRAVLVNGTKDLEKTLPDFLERDISSNPANGLYNIKVDVRGDSMFFMTRPEKGEISYRGKVMSGSVVRFNRYSHITGAEQNMEYIFYPDSRPASLEQR